MALESTNLAICDKINAMSEIKELRPCGTYAAARRHQRHGEPMCTDCKAVIAARQRQFYHKRKAARSNATAL